MMVVMMSCMRMLVAVMLLRDVTMYVVVCIGLVRMVRSLHIVRVGRFSVMSIRSMERVLFLGIIVTGTVLMYAEVVNMLLRGLRMAAMPHEDVEQETTEEAQHRLRRQNPQHGRRMYALRDKNRQHLIRGRQEDRDQGADRNHAARKQAGGRRREATLRQDTHDRTDQRPEVTGLLQHPRRMLLGLMLEVLHPHIGDKQERNQLRCIQYRIQKCV